MGPLRLRFQVQVELIEPIPDVRPLAIEAFERAGSIRFRLTPEQREAMRSHAEDVPDMVGKSYQPSAKTIEAVCWPATRNFLVDP